MLATYYYVYAFVSCIAAEVKVGKGLTRPGQTQIAGVVMIGNTAAHQTKSTILVGDSAAGSW